MAKAAGAKKKVGKPVWIPATPQQFNQIHRAAKASLQSLGAWILSAVLRDLERSKKTEPPQEAA